MHDNARQGLHSVLCAAAIATRVATLFAAVTLQTVERRRHRAPWPHGLVSTAPLRHGRRPRSSVRRMGCSCAQARSSRVVAAAALAACTTPIRHGRSCAAANPSGSTAWRTELTPTSRFFRAVRMGNGCQPPALLYVPDAQGSLHQGSTYCTYAIRVPGGVPYVPRTVAPRVAHMQPGKPLMPMRRADRQGEPTGGLAGRRLHILRARPEALGPARLLLFMTTAGPPPCAGSWLRR